MEKKKIFSILTDLYAFIMKYEKEHCVQLYKAECKKLVGKSLETRCPRVLNANKNLIYYTITYRCVHGRKYTYQSNNKRQSRTLRANCPMNINIKLTKDGNALEITSLNETHNHEISKDFYLSLPRQRKLNIEEQKDVKHLLQLKCNKKLVKAHVKTTCGKVITLRGLTNCKSSLNSNQSSISSSFNVPGIEIKKLKKTKINMLTNNEKYQKTIAIGEEIARLLSTYDTKDFYEQYGQLNYFRDLINQRKNIFVVAVNNDNRKSPINNMNDIEYVIDLEPFMQTDHR